jgi:hypothetical protein
MFVPCINGIKALLLFQNDAHNHKITVILKQLKIPTQNGPQQRIPGTNSP